MLPELVPSGKVWVSHPSFSMSLDIFHDRLSEGETPKFRRLIREARHVLCISANIAAEMRSNGAKSVSLLPLCSAFSVDGRQPFGSPLRIVVSGTIRRGVSEDAFKLLVDSWPAIKQQFPAVELHYCGASGKQLPRELLGEILDHGLLSHEAYQDLLRRCHLAYLPVSHPDHTVWRFSIPSRLADYLACGLPVIASTDSGSGIFSFLSSLPRGCAANVADTEALVQAVMAFAGDSVSWAEASAKAASYARQELRVENVRAELFRQLERF